MTIKLSQNGEITLSFTDVGKSYPSHEFLMRQVCLLTLFAKIKFLQNFSNLQDFFQNSGPSFKNSVDPDQLASVSC